MKYFSKIAVSAVLLASFVTTVSAQDTIVVRNFDQAPMTSTEKSVLKNFTVQIRTMMNEKRFNPEKVVVYNWHTGVHKGGIDLCMDDMSELIPLYRQIQAFYEREMQGGGHYGKFRGVVLTNWIALFMSKGDDFERAFELATAQLTGLRNKNGTDHLDSTNVWDCRR